MNISADILIGRLSRPAREVLHGVLDRLVQSLRGQLDLELDGGLGSWGRRDLHRREV